MGDELDRELKRINPRKPSNFHMENMCKHGSSCHGKNGSCPLNHPGVPMCRYEKDHEHRCKSHSCRYNHWKGRAEFVLGKRIAFQEKKLAEETDSTDSKKPEDSFTKNAFDVFRDSDDETSKSVAVSVAEKVISQADEDVSSVSSDGSGKSFQKVAYKRSKKLSREEYLERLKDQKKALLNSKKALKKSSKKSSKKSDTPPSSGSKEFPVLSQKEGAKDKPWHEKIADTKAKKEALIAELRLKAVFVLQNFYLIIKAKDFVAKKKAILAKQKEIKEARIQKKLEQAAVQAAEELDQQILSDMFSKVTVVKTSVEDENLSSKEKKQKRKAEKAAAKAARMIDPSIL